MWLDKIAKNREEKIELLNLFVDEFYKHVSRFEPDITNLDSPAYFVTFEDARDGDEVDCKVSDFEFKGFDELNKETNANIHWALFVCEHLNKTADKRKYWSEFKKYTLSKNSSLKEELKNSKPDFNKQPDFYL